MPAQAAGSSQGRALTRRRSSRRARSPWTVLFGALLLICGPLLAACQVQTSVSLVQHDDGSGVVAVSVDFDRAATVALGGQAALESELSYSDLQSSGWEVEPPRSTSSGGAVIAATHSYSTPQQAQSLLASLAGTGPAAERPFRLALVRTRSFWHVKTQLAGTVDLSCGLACFGDAGLRSALGSATGVDPATLGVNGTAAAAKIFRFALYATLPGRVTRTNAPATVPPRQAAAAVAATAATSSPQTRADPGSVAPGSAPATERWDPAVGQVTHIDLVTQSWNTGSIRMLVVTGSVAVLILVVLVAWTVRRWWRRRKGPPTRGAHSLGRAERAAAPEADPAVDVTPAT